MTDENEMTDEENNAYWDNFYWAGCFGVIFVVLVFVFIVIPWFKFLYNIHPVCVMIFLAFLGWWTLYSRDYVKKKKTEAKSVSENASEE